MDDTGATRRRVKRRRKDADSRAHATDGGVCVAPGGAVAAGAGLPAPAKTEGSDDDWGDWTASGANAGASQEPPVAEIQQDAEAPGAVAQTSRPPPEVPIARGSIGKALAGNAAGGSSEGTTSRSSTNRAPNPQGLPKPRVDLYSIAPKSPPGLPWRPATDVVGSPPSLAVLLEIFRSDMEAIRGRIERGIDEWGETKCPSAVDCVQNNLIRIFKFRNHVLVPSRFSAQLLREWDLQVPFIYDVLVATSGMIVEIDYRATHGARTDVDGRLQLRDPFSQEELSADQASGLYSDTFRLRYEEQLAHCEGIGLNWSSRLERARSGFRTLLHQKAFHSDQAGAASGSVKLEPHSPPQKPEASQEEVVKAMRLALQQAKKEPDTQNWLFGLRENRVKTDEDAGENRVKTEGAEGTKSEGATLKNAATCAKTESGTNICKAWNDARGCSGQRCPKGGAHVCDIKLLESKNPCGRTDHSRRSHDANKHGAIASRD